jgi:hypothetical protein
MIMIVRNGPFVRVRLPFSPFLCKITESFFNLNGESTEMNKKKGHKNSHKSAPNIHTDPKYTLYDMKQMFILQDNSTLLTKYFVKKMKSLPENRRENKS